jgi:uncharacterized membrane protein
MQIAKPHLIFLLGLILFSGLFFAIVIPPFQTPDEYNHNYKIHHLAEGHFLAEVDTPSVSLGGYVPQSLVEVSEYYYNITFKQVKKASIDTLKQLLAVPLQKDKTVFVSFPNTARYAFTSYMPMIPIFYILNHFNVNPILTMYIGRIVNFIVWLCCIYIGYLIMPIFKELYILLCALPGTISIHATLSADTFNNGLLFILIALFCDFKFSKKSISPTKLAIYFILTLIVAWNKIIYFPITLTLLLVPSEYFGTFKRKFIYISFLLASVFSIIFTWNHVIDRLIYPVEDEDVCKNTYHNLRLEVDSIRNVFVHVSPRLQIEEIKHQPISFLTEFLPAVFELYSYNNKTYISSVGRESTHTSTPLHTIFILFFLLYILNLENVFNKREKLFLGLLAYFMSALFLLSQHLHWGRVGGDIERAYFGKYFIAIYPIIFFALSGSYNVFEKFKINQVRLNWILYSLLFIVYIHSFIIALERFYF